MPNYNGFPANYSMQDQYQMNYQNYGVTTAVPATPMQMYQPRMWNNNWQTQQQMQQQPSQDIVWVQGKEAAKSHYVPNGSTHTLWDSEEPLIYLKRVDVDGKPSMTILKYEEVTEDDLKETKNNDEYDTKTQVDQLNKEFSALNEKLSNLSKYATKDQFDGLNKYLKDLGGQVEDIENRITSFGKPQQNSNYNNRKGNK